MKRRTSLGSACALLILSACGPAPSASAPIAAVRNASLHVVVTNNDHAAVLEVARPLLERQGLALVVDQAESEAIANARVADGEADVLCCEVRPTIQAYNAAHNAQLTEVAGIDIVPNGIFSRVYTTWENVPGGSVVAIARDPVGRGRALLQLRRIGVIDLEDPTNSTSDVANVSVNPLRLEFRLVDAAALGAQLSQADFVVMSVPAAEAAGLDPVADALNIEDGLSRFTNFLVARADNARDARVTALNTALTGAEVAAYLEQNNGGRLHAAFR